MTLRRKATQADHSILEAWREVDPRSLILACWILVALSIQLLVPLWADTPCGLIIPHEHILVGGADQHDLAAHEAAEAACASGRPAAPDQQVFDLHGSKGRIINIVHLDQATTTHPISVEILLASLPTPNAFQLPQQLSARLDPLRSPGQSIAIPPPTPPPESPL